MKASGNSFFARRRNSATTVCTWSFSCRKPNGQVWIVEDGKLRIHTVKPARVLADGVLLRADSIDLKTGDRVVITQLVTAIEGMRVRQSSETEGRSP